MSEMIAGTSYQREYDSNLDLHITTVVHTTSREVDIWCIGCSLSPTVEVIIPAGKLVEHIDRHRVWVEETTAGEPNGR